MKELSIEEKAKRYDEAIEIAKEWFKPEEPDSYTCIVESVFPELKESEDEKMVKFIKKQLFNIKKTITDNYKLDTELTKAIYWLEKQGEQRIVPKFEVGDVIRHKKHGFTCKITAVDAEYRVSGCNGNHLPFDSQDAYELVEQNPAWSEEDEYCRHQLISFCENCMAQDACSKRCAHWLKSLKERYTWKPSDEQMKALKEACDEHWEPDGLDPLYTLYQDLKKLKQ